MSKHIFRPGVMPEAEPAELIPGPVPAWSYSVLSDFEKCQYKTYLAKVQKIKAESNEAANRGTGIHELAEAWIKGELEELPKDLAKFTDDFDSLRAGYVEGDVLVEDPWGFDIDWNSCDWWAPEIWCRVKLDAYVIENSTSAMVIDFKTGRKDGNEIAHSTQAQLYTIAAFMRKPELEYVACEFWYLDKGQKLKKSYTREHAMMFLPRWIERATKLTTCTEFIPNPSMYSCKWCPYSKDGSCEWAFKN